jgi:hypothetical protein
MTIIRRLPALVAMPLVAAMVTACDLGNIFPPPRLVYIEVDGDTVVAVGDTIRLTAKGTRGLIASTPDPLWDAKWSSTDNRVATVIVVPRPRADTLSSPVLVQGVQPGRVVIVVSARGVSATHIVSVRDSVDQSMSSDRIWKIDSWHRD